MRRLHISIVRAPVVALLALAGPLGAQAIDGVWAAEGYGMLYDFNGTAMRAYEVTRISCIPTYGATRQPSPPPGAEAAYKQDDSPSTFLVLADRSADRKRIHSNGAASDIVMRRIAARPPMCDRAAESTSRATFDIFARTWAEQYGFFDIRGVDWPKVVEVNRARVTDATTPDELFEIFKGMVEPFHDAHTGLAATALKKNFGGFRDRANRLDRADAQKALDVVNKHYLKGPLHEWCNGRVQYGSLGDSIGYLRITSFSGYGPERGFESGLVALEAALDTIFSTPGLRGLVIDVRINGGGADPYGLAIAARLTTNEYVAYAKQARLDPDDASKWTEAQPSVVKPSTRPGFRGAVVELTGLLSVSAAETFTQALLNRTPKVTRVGDNTQGVFSDVLGRVLPNGWQFWLPNERFVTNGKAYDGPGIPPDVRVPAFTKADIEAGRDPALESALEVVRTAAAQHR